MFFFSPNHIYIKKSKKSHKTALVFRKPVTDRDAPGYSDRILFPMDLSLVRKMITSQQIQSLEDLHTKIALICHNCMKFNGGASDYGIVAKDFEAYVDDAIIAAVENATAAAAVATTPTTPTEESPSSCVTNKEDDNCDELKKKNSTIDTTTPSSNSSIAPPFTATTTEEEGDMTVKTNIATVEVSSESNVDIVNYVVATTAAAAASSKSMGRTPTTSGESIPNSGNFTTAKSSTGKSPSKNNNHPKKSDTIDDNLGLIAVEKKTMNSSDNINTATDETNKELIMTSAATDFRAGLASATAAATSDANDPVMENNTAPTVETSSLLNEQNQQPPESMNNTNNNRTEGNKDVVTPANVSTTPSSNTAHHNNASNKITPSAAAPTSRKRGSAGKKLETTTPLKSNSKARKKKKA
jgi:hypothetical protein